jgi:3-hydroxyacyl-CoA dehydrogenase/3a,7a,12a-trihydroxy-5b-cholest-24-enoyl-CoA hydratase
VSGKADSMKLFQGGKLKITGNVMASQKLEFLKKIDRGAAPAASASASAAPAPAASTGGAITTAQTFDVIAAHVAKAPELTKINMVYQFKISSPDSSWVIDLKAGKVFAGTAEKADCTLALSDSDWNDMVTGKADSMKLFQGGKLKITGNVMASQKLEFLKKLDRSSMPAPSAAAAPAASAAPQGNSAEVLAPKVFKALQERIAKNPALAKEVNSVISFKVKDAGFEFTADLASATPSIKPGVDAKAHTRIVLTDEALGALSKGESAQKLYQHGQLRIDGDLTAAHRLGFLKQLV